MIRALICVMDECGRLVGCSVYITGIVRIADKYLNLVVIRFTIKPTCYEFNFNVLLGLRRKLKLRRRSVCEIVLCRC